MIPPPGMIVQENRLTIVLRDENIHRSVIVKISQGQAARGQGPRKYRSALAADIVKLVAISAKQQ